MKHHEIYNLINKLPKSVEEADKIIVPRFEKKFSQVTIIGMGGSYIAGLIMQNLLKNKIKVNVYNTIPKIIPESSLVILISYSGNTKEILNAFNQLKKENLLVISSGGKLLLTALKNKKKTLRIPSHLHQRFTLVYLLVPLINFFSNFKLLKKSLVKKIIKSLKKNRTQIEQEAKKLAVKLEDKLPLFYASEFFYPIAYRLQTSIEEDVKIICHSNVFPEIFHNELESLDENSHPVLILDKNDVKPYKKQIEFFKNHIKNYYEIKFNKTSKQIRLFLLVYFTDFLGYYLSLIKKNKIFMGETPVSDGIKEL